MKGILITLLCVSQIYAARITQNSDGTVIEHYSDEKPREKKIAFITVLVNEPYRQAVSYGTKTKRDYCAIHGYDFITATEKLSRCLDYESKCVRHPSWTKVPLAAKYLAEYDWVFHCDADTVIMNDDITLESIIDQYPQYDFLMSRRNAGIWFIRNCEEAKDFLQTVWGYGEGTIYATHKLWEQGPINSVCDNNIINNFNTINKLPGNLMNSKPSFYQEGDFLVHFSSATGKNLSKCFEEFKKKKEGGL